MYLPDESKIKLMSGLGPSNLYKMNLLFVPPAYAAYTWRTQHPSVALLLTNFSPTEMFSPLPLAILHRIPGVEVLSRFRYSL